MNIGSIQNETERVYNLRTLTEVSYNALTWQGVARGFLQLVLFLFWFGQIEDRAETVTAAARNLS